MADDQVDELVEWWAEKVKRDDAPSRLQIISDGTPVGTTLLVDGEPVSNVVRATWEISESDGFARCVVEFERVPVLIDGASP